MYLRQKMKEDDCETDHQKAVEYFRKAVELGNTNAMLNLGDSYLRGIGVRRDANKAIELFERSAKLGDDNAMNYLAQLYHNGTRVPRDLDKARALYEKAVTYGNPSALFNLAYMFQHGQSVEKSSLLAVDLFIQSSKKSPKQRRMIDERLFVIISKHPEAGPIGFDYFRETKHNLPHLCKLDFTSINWWRKSKLKRGHLIQFTRYEKFTNKFAILESYDKERFCWQTKLWNNDSKSESEEVLVPAYRGKFTAFSCKKGHTLNILGKDRNSGWMCDGWMEPDLCDYDLCIYCVHKYG